MATIDSVGPAYVAEAASRLVLASRPELLPSLRSEVERVLGRRVGPVLGALTPDCPRAPLKVAGPRVGTGAELTALAELTRDAGVWAGRARLAGAERPLLVVAIPAPDGRLASVFAFELPDDEPLPQEHLEIARG